MKIPIGNRATACVVSSQYTITRLDNADDKKSERLDEGKN